jgi:hypothetical protein
MHVGVKPGLRTNAECGLMFLPLHHTSCRWANSQSRSVKMSSQGIMSGKKATNYWNTIKEDAMNSAERNTSWDADRSSANQRKKTTVYAT